MQNIQVILLIGVLALGLINISYRIFKVNEELDIVVNYQNKLVEFLNSYNRGNILYGNLDYMNKNSCEVQDIIDRVGMSVSMIDTVLGLKYNQYQIIINGVDEISRDLNSGFGRMSDEISLMMHNCLGKYIGYAERNRKELVSYLKNPLTWLREGIRIIVGFPVYFLYWTGLIKYSSYSKIKSNILVKLIGFIIGTIGFISAIMSIVTGYKPFIDIIGR